MKLATLKQVPANITYSADVFAAKQKPYPFDHTADVEQFQSINEALNSYTKSISEYDEEVNALIAEYATGKVVECSADNCYQELLILRQNITDFYVFDQEPKTLGFHACRYCDSFWCLDCHKTEKIMFHTCDDCGDKIHSGCSLIAACTFCKTNNLCQSCVNRPKINRRCKGCGGATCNACMKYDSRISRSQLATTMRDTLHPGYIVCKNCVDSRHIVCDKCGSNGYIAYSGNPEIRRDTGGSFIYLRMCEKKGCFNWICQMCTRQLDLNIYDRHFCPLHYGSQFIIYD